MRSAVEGRSATGGHPLLL